MLIIGKLYKLSSIYLHECSGETCTYKHCLQVDIIDNFIICSNEVNGDEYATTIYNDSIGIYLDSISLEPINYIDCVDNGNLENITYCKFLVEDKLIFLREDSFQYVLLGN